MKIKVGAQTPPCFWWCGMLMSVFLISRQHNQGTKALKTFFLNVYLAKGTERERTKRETAASNKPLLSLYKYTA
jgi:hypothetical protein